jgi:Na+/proline symporter
MIQFSAGGRLLSEMASISYNQAALLIGGIVTGYLFIGGFRTVILTDILQGLARLVLILLLGGLFFRTFAGRASAAPVEMLPLEIVVGLTLTGLFSAIASSDVWQRVYAARSNTDAAVGLILGAAAMMLFGALLVFIGLVAKGVAPDSLPDAAFSTALGSSIPSWATVTAVALVLVSVLSTADTEIFLLASLIGREAGREGVSGVAALQAESPPRWARLTVLIVGGTSTVAALYFSNVLSVYVWLLGLLLAIAPVVCVIIFVNLDRRVVGLGLVLNVLLFGALASVGKLTVDTAYYIVVPGFVVLLALHGLTSAHRALRSRGKGR